MPIKSVALVAHDHKKADLIAWAEKHQQVLSKMTVFATGTTGKLLNTVFNDRVKGLLSGPLGGDQQIGAKIAEGEIELLIFFWDPLEPMPHDPDIKALLRIAALWNIPVACNEASADFIIHSTLIDKSYHRRLPQFDDYLNRSL